MLVALDPPAACAQAQSPAPAATPDANALYTSALGAFDRGDYQATVTEIDVLLAKIPADLPPADKEKLSAQLEPIYFTMGAAYFNLKDWSKALAAFKDYLSRYPQGTRVNDARLLFAQAAFLAKDYETASHGFAALEENPKTYEQALLYQALSYKEAGNTDKAISQLEKLTAAGVRSGNAARGALLLVGLYDKKQPQKAAKLLAELRANIAQVEDPVALNAAELQQGDGYLEADDAAEALDCYRAVLGRNEVVALLRERAANLQRRVESNKSAARANPRNAIPILLANKQLLDSIADVQNTLQAFEKSPDLRPKLLFRIGRASTVSGKPWEALVAYGDILDASKDPVDREPALFGVATAYVDAGRLADARSACEAYLKEFPKGPNADSAGYLLGTTALQQSDLIAAASYFGRMLREQPDSKMAGEMRFLLGNANFVQSKYDEARKEYERYQKDYPDGSHAEEVVYRLALGDLFTGKYDEALKRINAYLQRYAHGAFVVDAQYRRALCLFADQQNDEAVAACQDWLRQYLNDQETGEVLSLLGDALNAQGHADEALDAYVKSYKAAANDEVFGYAIMEAEKILQKRGDWPAIGAMFRDFVRERPNHPLVATAMFWIVRADTKLGKIDEAKRFLADNIKRVLPDRHREGVEGLLDQLAAVCARRKPTAASPASTPGPDPVVELDALLGDSANDQSNPSQARILYAKSELARLRRHDDEARADLLEIAAKFPPGELSALLLGRVGDALVSADKAEDARPFYQELLKEFPRSDAMDYAYNGLGQLALLKHQYDEALRYFNQGIDESRTPSKLKDLTLGRAQALLGLGRYDEAKKGFEQVAATKEWRGDATAASVFSLGEIEARQGRWAEANAYYQRVFVGYQRFLPWVARAYLGSGESLEKLGKPQDAINTYREMLRNEKLAALPEANQARERLKAMGAS